MTVSPLSFVCDDGGRPRGWLEAVRDKGLREVPGGVVRRGRRLQRNAHMSHKKRRAREGRGVETGTRAHSAAD